MSDHSPSKQGKPQQKDLRIIKMEAKKPIVLPKKANVPPTLSSQLTESENAVYQKRIKEFKMQL